MPIKRRDSKLTSLRNGLRESISRQRREASQLGIVDIETARRLDKQLSGARFVILLKWRSTRHLRLIKPSIPAMVGGSSNSSDSNPESLQSGASDVIRHRQGNTCDRRYCRDRFHVMLRRVTNRHTPQSHKTVENAYRRKLRIETDIGCIRRRWRSTANMRPPRSLRHINLPQVGECVHCPRSILLKSPRICQSCITGEPTIAHEMEGDDIEVFFE